MKVCSIGLDLPEGKIKYHDDKFLELVKKCDPLKITPFYVEFIQDDFVHADAFVVAADNVLDLLILDMEKLEGRRDRTDDDVEKDLIGRCLEMLEGEEPLCDGVFSQEELVLLKTLAPLSLKPTLVVKEPLELNDIISQVLEKASMVFFYTVGKKEVHAWPVPGMPTSSPAPARFTLIWPGALLKLTLSNMRISCTSLICRKPATKNWCIWWTGIIILRTGDIVEIRFNV